LKNQIQALMVGADLTSSIEPIKDEGDEAKRTADFDWYLQDPQPVSHRAHRQPP
jgi:hypothetical protein